MKKLLLLSSSLLFSFYLEAQTFTDLQKGWPTMTGASFAWGDYDNDDDSDLVIMGFSSQTSEVTNIYRNDGGGVFTLLNSGIVHLSNGSASWGDYDTDGNPDLLLTGMNNGTAVTALYHNDGNDVFTSVSTDLPPLIGIARWIDYDNDGSQDVIMAGWMGLGSSDSTELFHNDGNGIFTEASTDFPDYAASDIAVADYDDDGDEDFFLIGYYLGVSSTRTELCRNDGNGVFSLVPFDFDKLSTGTAKWGDYDNDGDLDLLYDGIDSTAVTNHTILYRNESADSFTLVNANLPASGEPGSVDFGDVNNDGTLDILLSGAGFPGVKLLRNDGNDVFTDITPINFGTAVPSGFIDMDNDGDLDVIVIRQFGAGSTILRNDMIALSDQQVSSSVSYELFPVPADNFVLIRNGCLSATTSLNVYDASGQLVISRLILSVEGASDIRFNCAGLRQGVYFAEFISENSIVRKKLVVEHL
ncbi:MAG TPA: T9SS type A sorting domain-containing protein [Chitinophagales bacterium]|nr:T9SS type A sorting domain-containing protein [Chitinophagales bacterium]